MNTMHTAMKIALKRTMDNPLETGSGPFNRFAGPPPTVDDLGR
jgi:hypothetical protein